MGLIEIRLHGRGGQGVVKASQIIVKAAVECELCAQFIPFFGVERKGSPVYGFLRIDDDEIRRKTQIYEPDVIIVMDDTLCALPQTFAGLKQGGTVLVNSTKPLGELCVPSCAGSVAAVDATGISEELFGQNLPNTAVVGAFARVVGLVDVETLLDEVAAAFGDKNRIAAERGYAGAHYLKGGKAGE